MNDLAIINAMRYLAKHNKNMKFGRWYCGILNIWHYRLWLVNKEGIYKEDLYKHRVQLSNN